MSPEPNTMSVARHPQTLLRCALVCAAVFSMAGGAFAQPDKGKKDAPKGDAKPDKGDGKKKDDKPNVIDFEGMNFNGQLRTPQLLYFLDRAAEELERASLERRSFIPEMVRSIDEEGL